MDEILCSPAPIFLLYDRIDCQTRYQGPCTGELVEPGLRGPLCKNASVKDQAPCSLRGLGRSQGSSYVVKIREVYDPFNHQLDLPVVSEARSSAVGSNAVTSRNIKFPHVVQRVCLRENAAMLRPCHEAKARTIFFDNRAIVHHPIFSGYRTST